MRQSLMAGILLLVLAVAGVATWQLIRTVEAADDIEDQAVRIARNGRGINIATDSVIQLRRTNRLAGTILQSARPLDEQLVKIVGRGRSIDATAGAIDATAGEINQTAGAINESAGEINQTAGEINATAVEIDQTAGNILGVARRVDNVAGSIEDTAGRIDVTASGINAEAAEILEVAEQIDRDVRLINLNLNDSIALARAIEADTTDILGLAGAVHQTAACLDQRTSLPIVDLGPGPLIDSDPDSGFDGHCAVSDEPPPPGTPPVAEGEAP